MLAQPRGAGLCGNLASPSFIFFWLRSPGMPTAGSDPEPQLRGMQWGRRVAASSPRGAASHSAGWKPTRAAWFHPC